MQSRLKHALYFSFLISLLLFTVSSCSKAVSRGGADAFIRTPAPSALSLSSPANDVLPVQTSNTSPTSNPGPTSSPFPAGTMDPRLKAQPVKEIDGMVLVKDVDSSIMIDMKYASTDNFIGKRIYPADICILRKETAEKLSRANSELGKKGFRVKIWDAYRPLYVQEIFWDLVRDSRFVADPKTGGSRHNYGTAVDITLADEKGQDLVMPSKFDDFTEKAYRSNPGMLPEARRNLNLLTEAMRNSGFITIDTEWWHYEDSEYANYKLPNVRLEQFAE